MDNDRNDGQERRETQKAETFEAIAEQYLARRAVLKGVAGLSALAAGGLTFFPNEADAKIRTSTDTGAISFTPVPESTADRVTVPAGYEANVVVKWGDPLVPGLGAFDVNNQSAADQAQRFGFNNDMIALFPERFGAPAKVGGMTYPSYLMCVNHEYTSGTNMFPGYVAGSPTRSQVETEWAGHGISVAHIRLANSRWSVDRASRFNRRITATTPIAITGPAAGHALMKTPADPAGTRVLGTLNNCAGGWTPWGTYLSAEENFNQYFANAGTVADSRAKADHADLGMPSGASDRRWEQFDSRFDTAKPEGVNEPFRFGWIVEVDPYDPTSTPKKRTALGRCKHEAAMIALNAANKVVAYSGDDERFEYLYKFISAGTYNASNRAANLDLLENGTLYVAKFNADGTGQWLALDVNNATTGAALRAATYADGAARFPTNAEVMINARRAGDAVGATPMDRPEDVDVRVDAKGIGNGKVYLICTNNSNRAAAGTTTTATRSRPAQVNTANPRADNRTGHIIEITEAGGDNAALTFSWRFFLLAGDPAAASGARGDVRGSMTGDRFGSPDNCTFDNFGNIWIATDGNPASYPCNDQVLVARTDTAVGSPVQIRRFLTGPAGAEVCGPLLTPDNAFFFCALQHPGEDQPGVTTNAQSKWPDGDFPKSGIVAVRRTDGGRVGS